MRFKILRRGGYGSGGFNTAGGNVSGPVVLPGDPTEPLHASNKNYVDVKLNNLSGADFKTGTLPIERLPSFSGDAVTVAGSNSVTLSDTGVTPGSYAKVRVDSKGRITNGYTLVESDLPEMSWNKIGAGKPITLAGYGITDSLKPEGGVLTGLLKSNVMATNALHSVNKEYIDNLSGGNVNGLKTGDIIRKITSVTPSGFLRCNGGQVSKTEYSALYSIIGDAYSISGIQGSGKPWKQQYQINTEQSGDITGWTTGTSLPVALAHPQAIVTKNRVYLLGGAASNGSSYLTTVYTAPINEDGTLGTWTTGTALPGKVAGSQAIVTKNRVYLLGGHNGNYSSTVYTAPINEDGTLGTWTTGTSLPGTVAYSQAIVTKSRVYLLGGYINGSYSSTVYTAPINEDGTLGTWTTGTALPGTVGHSQAVVTKNRIYLLGGVNSGAVYTAPINTDGTLGAWTTENSLPGALYGSQAIVTKNRVYLLGGVNGGTVSTVYTASINADGTLGTWITGTPLPGALGYSQAVVTKNRVYLLGGNDSNGYASTVRTAPILGGLNDYSPYYDGTFIPTDSTNFRLPDLSSSELQGSYTYIKA